MAELTIQTARSTWHKENINNALSLVLVRTRGVKVFDFRRGEYGKKLFLIEQRPRIVKTAILCGVALVLGIVAMVLDGHYSRKALRRVDEQVKAVFTATFPEVRRIEAPLQQMKVKIREERDKHSEIGAAARNVSVVDILNDISMLIPNRMDVALTDVTIGPENMSLSGHAANFEMVNDMRTSLERAKWVDTSIISSANQDKTGKRVDFKIRIVFNNVTDQNA